MQRLFLGPALRLIARFTRFEHAAEHDRQGNRVNKQKFNAKAPGAQGPPRQRACITLRDASGYDRPSEPPTGIRPGILAVLFRVFATWRGAFGY
jgi:hypothetical protein